MQKLTLKFPSFQELSSFARELKGGYLINTSTLTLTSFLPEFQANLAVETYNAQLIETNERVYCYDPL